MTLEEITLAWEPDSEVTTWSDIRAEWPDKEIGFYGRPEGSGTFAYFSHFVAGEAGSLREGYETTDDTDELARWIAEDEFGIGFMGVGNYLAAPGEDRDRITNVSVEGVAPSRENAQNGDYHPFTRPLLLYVNAEMADQDEDLAEFVDYYVAEIEGVMPRVYFYAMSAEEHTLASDRWADRVTGTIFGGDPFGEVDLASALAGGAR